MSDLRPNPAACYYCGHKGIYSIGDHEQVNKTSIAFGRKCSRCHKAWFDIFQLIENRTEIH